MTLPNFVKDIVEKLEANDVNRNFTNVSKLDAARIDVVYEDLDAVIQDTPKFITTFNGILATKREKLNTIKHLQKHLKDLAKKVNEEQEE